MRERLEGLRAELQKGQQEMARLDLRRQELRDTMLRISGAIQVLEELESQVAAPNPQAELAAITS
jgi:prefoldin subunit 5